MFYFIPYLENYYPGKLRRNLQKKNKKKWKNNSTFYPSSQFSDKYFPNTDCSNLVYKIYIHTNTKLVLHKDSFLLKQLIYVIITRTKDLAINKYLLPLGVLAVNSGSKQKVSSGFPEAGRKGG